MGRRGQTDRQTTINGVADTRRQALENATRCSAKKAEGAEKRARVISEGPQTLPNTHIHTPRGSVRRVRSAGGERGEVLSESDRRKARERERERVERERGFTSSGSLSSGGHFVSFFFFPLPQGSPLRGHAHESIERW